MHITKISPEVNDIDRLTLCMSSQPAVSSITVSSIDGTPYLSTATHLGFPGMSRICAMLSRVLSLKLYMVAARL